MPDVLKGNFQVKRPVEVEQKADDLNTQFEREALKRLGGSIAFVSKKKFLFGMEQDASAAEAAHAQAGREGEGGGSDGGGGVG